MKETLCAVLCLLLLIACTLGGALHGFEEVALDSSEYDRLQEKLNVYEYVGIDSDALSRVNRRIAEYLSGKASSLSMEEEIFGVRSQVFNEREKEHMIDVLNLFRLVHNLKVGLLLASALMLAVFMIAARPHVISLLIRAFAWFIRGAGVLLLVGVVLVLTLGFDRLFILFHELFFTNDLWLMNPLTDTMIRMFPSEFFRRIALDAGISALKGVVIAQGTVLLLCGTVFRSTFRRK